MLVKGTSGVQRPPSYTFYGYKQRRTAFEIATSLFISIVQ